MDTPVKTRALVVAALLGLSACSGVGMSKFNYSSPLEETQDEKDEDTWWDKLYGRKANAPESKAWKDFYKAPNTDQTKPDYCGYWGNCAKDDDPGASSCNFYGNCATNAKKSGWW